MSKIINEFNFGDFQLKEKESPHRPPIINKYVIEIVYCLEEGDYSQKENQTITLPAVGENEKINLLQTLLEIEIFKLQFPHGKNSQSPCYNQINYFCPDNYETSDLDKILNVAQNTIPTYTKTDNYWNWVENVPYSYDSETSYDIAKYHVYHYDAQGQKTIMDLSIPTRFQNAVKDFNSALGINAYNMEKEDWDKNQFIDYRQKAVALLEKEMLNLKLNMAPQEPNTAFDISTPKRQKI